MKFSIDRKDLADHIQYLINIVPSKNTMPILTNFLIEAVEEDNMLIFTVTDLEITVITKIEANVSESGKIAVSARRLMEIISRLPDNSIDFSLNEDDIIINSNSIVFDLHCADANQYPLIPTIDLAEANAIDADIFSKMIKNTIFAVSTELNRPIFTGINWVLDPEFQMMSSTDGKRISEFKHNKPTHVEERIERIIPTKGLNFMDKIINENTKIVRVLIHENRVIFSYGPYTLISHVIEGRYPNYDKAMPQDNNDILLINKGVLKNAVRRVSLMATEDTYKIHLNIKDNQIDVDCINRDEGEAREIITDFEYDGNDREISFNYKFLLDILNVIETEKVKIKMGPEKIGSLFFNHGDNEDYSTRFLLMPLRAR